MKKTIKLFGLLMVAGTMLFTSCGKDENDPTPVVNSPVINFMGGAGYTSADATMLTGAAFKVGINASENATSKKNLESYKVVRTFNNVPTTVFEETGIGASTYSKELDVEANAEVGVERWTFTITDKDGLMEELAFTITTEASTHPLGNATALEWKRIGGAAATGLNGFGLKWTSNLKEVMAVIQKNGADKFVQLSAADWTSLTTKEDLEGALMAGVDMTEWKGVSAEAGNTYDEVLATSYNGEYFLIHITAATVVVEAVGTTITITGESKK